MLREVFVRLVLRELVRALDLDQVERRASFVASQLFGLALVRYVLRLPAVTAMTPDEVARWIGPTIQRYLQDELPLAGTLKPRSAAPRKRRRRGQIAGVGATARPT